MFQRARRLAALFALLFVASFAASGEGPGESGPTPLDTAFQQASLVAVSGPARVPLRDQATLALPPGYMFIPRPQADTLMQEMGNQVDERFLGLVFPESDESWFVVAEYESSGYIKDDDAKNWDVDDLFESLRDGTEAANAERRARGFPELELVGWVEKPHYDAVNHRLVWSMSARHKGAEADDSPSVNYNTYALGREGYVTLNLIADQAEIEGYKSHAGALLSALEYNPGKKYTEFNESTDRMAEYGLAALVGGVAAKKIGLLGLIAAFVAKFGKLVALGAVAAAGGAFKFFRRSGGSNSAGGPQ